MNKLFTSVAIFAALSAALVGCIGDDRTPETDRQIRFVTTIAKSNPLAGPGTRASGDNWEPDDRIGVYMFRSDDTDPKSPLAVNKQYGNTLPGAGRSAVFSGIDEDNVITWPDDNGKVDFTAYYPWREEIELIFPVDISVQDTQREIDLMWSNNMTRRNSSTGNPDLAFKHRLVKLVFNVTDQSGASLEGLRSTFAGLATRADFDISTGVLTVNEGSVATFDAGTTLTTNNDETGEGEAAAVEAIVLPGDDLDYTLTFRLSSGEQAVFTVTDADYDAGSRYIYNIRLTGSKGGNIDFDADGELNAIDEWSDQEDETQHEVPKEGGNNDGANDGNGEGDGSGDGPVTPLAPGAAWHSGVLSLNSQGYAIPEATVTGTVNAQNEGLKMNAGSSLTIVKDDYSGGVASVTVEAATNGFAASGQVSVSVGGTSFVLGGNETTLNITSTEPSDYVFQSPSGEAISGDIKITLSASGGQMFVYGFAVNAEIP